MYIQPHCACSNSASLLYVLVRMASERTVSMVALAALLQGVK